MTLKVTKIRYFLFLQKILKPSFEIPNDAPDYRLKVKIFELVKIDARSNGRVG